MTPERAKLLGELLAEMGEDPKGFIPDEAWPAVQKTFALPYVELAIVRKIDEAPEILLMHRTDADWEGWHIPGGLWRPKQTLDEAIASLAKRELGGGTRVSLLAKGDWEKWHDHPYGLPISHVVICQGESIVETDTARWSRGVPEGMIKDNGHHAGFITGVLRQVVEQKLM